MSKITNNEFIVLEKTKKLIISLEDYMCNIPKKDNHYIFEIRESYKMIFKKIVRSNEVRGNIEFVTITEDIAYINFLIECIFKKK